MSLSCSNNDYDFYGNTITSKETTRPLTQNELECLLVINEHGRMLNNVGFIYDNQTDINTLVRAGLVETAVIDTSELWENTYNSRFVYQLTHHGRSTLQHYSPQRSQGSTEIFFGRIDTPPPPAYDPEREKGRRRIGMPRLRYNRGNPDYRY